MDADFPLFEWNEEGQRLEAMHHPFTAPNPEDMQGCNGASLKTARALAYDLVYNGVEIAGRTTSSGFCTYPPTGALLVAFGMSGLASRGHHL